MLWKEIPNQDPSKTWLFYIQNFAKTPTAYVHLYITDGEAPNQDSQPQQTLIALQVIRIYIQPNFKVYFAEENGGICTSIKTEKIPFVNYDVPTYHKNIPLTEEYEFTAPEGSEIVFQNFSGEGDCFINIGGGDGWIRATRFATLIDSFHDDTIIRIKGETGSEVISIIQKQSLAVTQLSDENIALLEDLITRVELIEKNYVTKPELDETLKRTNYGIWSPYSTVTKQTTNNIRTQTFKSRVDEYRSALYENGRIIKIVNSFTISYNNGTKVEVEKGYLSFDLLLSENKNDKVLSIYSDNVFIKKNLKTIKLNRNKITDELDFEYHFNTTCDSIQFLTTIRGEEISSSITDTPISIGFTNIYNIDLCNGDIIFTDRDFFLKLLEPFELFQIPPNSLSRYYINRGNTMVETIMEDNYNIHKIQDGSCIIKYYEPFEPKLYKARCEIEMKKDPTIKSVLGFMLIPFDDYLEEMSAITINLSACLSEKQRLSSVGSITTLVNPIYTSEKQDLKYLNVYKSVTLDVLNKSKLYLIVQKVGD